MYALPNCDYKVLPDMKDMFVEISFDKLEGVKKFAFDGTSNIPGVTFEALKRNKEKLMPQIQPGEIL